jgi:hypothetical protein
MPHLLIGTPAYGGQVHVDYLNSVLAMQQAGLPFSLMTIGNESLITRARNTILAAFHERAEYSHLLFIDGDVQIAAADVQQMVDMGKDVIGAAVSLKGRNPDGTRIFNLGRCMGEDGPLYRVERVGTAVFMLSRKAVDALVDAARAQGGVYERGLTTRGEDTAKLHYDVFRTGVVKNEYLSEDYWVCHELRRLGFGIYIDPRIVTRHNGTVAV